MSFLLLMQEQQQKKLYQVTLVSASSSAVYFNPLTITFATVAYRSTRGHLKKKNLNDIDLGWHLQTDLCTLNVILTLS